MRRSIAFARVAIGDIFVNLFKHDTNALCRHLLERIRAQPALRAAPVYKFSASFSLQIDYNI